MNYSVSNTKEIAFEQAIERHLTGTTTEALKDGAWETGPYRIGQRSDFDATLALDTKLFWEFLEATQGKALEKLKTRNPADWQAKITGQLDSALCPINKPFTGELVVESCEAPIKSIEI